ncbi:sulfotransferase domain-containing protein [cf. Phormidesmis sp. LEGE 11477]|uniref:sulfotransferase domain-containing protein n=1 Tax=cf. Phormidesmis sp. LEGE 11477 TaxID=1828680 RepID=UPI0018826564|nr:sulfotransferase domain-containing protein [cf. Phormidesmis sp. LEGE 11477]MBE9062331.1 sulfotransferase domain-containing protein [cf. Phormidesmis sp. LEGE 11477]
MSLKFFNPGTYGDHLARAKQLSKQAIIRANYYLGNYQPVIWLAGDGRSGTTWVSNLLNWHGSYREMFEPFHPELVSGLESFKLHHYLRVNETAPSQTRILESIYSGNFYHERPDAFNRRLLYEGLLVKDIFANLLVGWVKHNLSHVRPVLVVRNPFAVALSKQKRTQGVWMTEPRDFLSQPALVEDYLLPFKEVIEQVGDDFIERQILIWSIIHYVPFRQLALGDAYILFYENLFEEPEKELAALFSYLFEGVSVTPGPELLAKIRKPSQTPGKDNNILLGKSPIESWKDELSSAQIDRGINILGQFGLDKVYGTRSRPDKNFVENFISRDC